MQSLQSERTNSYIYHASRSVGILRVFLYRAPVPLSIGCMSRFRRERATWQTISARADDFFNSVFFNSTELKKMTIWREQVLWHILHAEAAIPLAVKEFLARLDFPDLRSVPYHRRLGAGLTFAKTFAVWLCHNHIFLAI